MRLGKKKPTEQVVPQALHQAYNTYNSTTYASGGGISPHGTSGTFHQLLGNPNYWPGTPNTPNDYYQDRPIDGFKDYRMVKVKEGEVVVAMPPEMLDDLIALLDDDEDGTWTDVLEHLVEAAKQIKQVEEKRKRQEEEAAKHVGTVPENSPYDKLVKDYNMLFGKQDSYIQQSLFRDELKSTMDYASYEKLMNELAAYSLFGSSKTSPSA